MSSRRLRWAALAIVAVGVGACAEEPASPSEQTDLLAATFDGYARQSNQEGDPDASLAFAHAAMAVRLGIRPTTISVSVDDQPVAFQALVHVVRHRSLDNVPALRTMIAFRQSEPDQPPSRVLYLAITIDSARVAHPANLSPLPFAWAVWKDLGKREVWVATQGKAGIKQQSTGDPCPKALQRNVSCTLGLSRRRLPARDPPRGSGRGAGPRDSDPGRGRERRGVSVRPLSRFGRFQSFPVPIRSGLSTGSTIWLGYSGAWWIPILPTMVSRT